jgi:hypothetical protein
MGGRHNTANRSQRCRIGTSGESESFAYAASRRIPEEGSTRPHGSDDPDVSLHLLDHRIQPAAQHLLGETESEPLDGVER